MCCHYDCCPCDSGPLFKYDEPNLGMGIALTTQPMVIAALGSFKHLHKHDLAWLTATVAWQATSGTPFVILSIDRVINGAATTVYSIRDSRESGYDRWGDSSLNHVDSGNHGKVTYQLLASLDPAQGGAASVYKATLSGRLFRN